ncbi:SPFH domain-containing protein [bacterium]|nr:SPFH domain-containing protein [bacterium]
MSQEIIQRPATGWSMLFRDIALYLASIALFILMILSYEANSNLLGTLFLLMSLPALIAAILISAGFIVLQPNESAVLLLFGKYRYSVKEGGFWWVNPFYTKRKVSLRLRNHNGDRLKVNDKAGNPIEIALVLVWKVEDTFAALFEVDDYMQYVKIQSESALRHLATAYPYDSWEDHANETSLRGNIDDVSKALENELQDRLSKAGVKVLEARLSHLAYTPEIAEAMLRRQQATAIVAARVKIVEGAVGMVQLALKHLEADNVVHLDEERKAAMVSNLLVVLCGEHNAQPVVNTGTLYT